MTPDDLSALRRDYAQAALSERDVDPDPLAQFQRWFDQARAARLAVEPNAMTLATTSRHGAPSARIVLLKAVDARGFTFYTDYRSRKALELDANPHAALVFYWAELERQVRVTGTVSKLSAAESDAYFSTRPRGSQLGAWASYQSHEIDGRASLEARHAEMEKRFLGDTVPRPPHWGGYLLAPDTIEFWQGRASRLHDRLQYTRAAGGAWQLRRLSP